MTGDLAAAVGVLLLGALAIGAVGVAIGMLLAPRLDRWARRGDEEDGEP